MSSLRDMNFKTDPTVNEQDKPSKANNGYAIMMLPTLESITNKLNTETSLKSTYQGFVKLSQRELGVGLLVFVLAGLVFASVPEGLLHSCCTLFKCTSRVFLPGLTVLSVFYWASITVQKYFHSNTSLLAIPMFLATEMFTQLAVYITGTSQIMSYFMLLSLLTFSILLLVSSFRNEGTYTFVVLLLLTNVFERMMAGQTQLCVRYFLINLSACFGDFLTRVTDTPVDGKPVAEIEAKVSLATKNNLKVRRSSSTSSTGSNRRRTSLPALGFQAKGSIDPTTLGEAHGMLSDLLADSNLPANVASTLKIISTMIAQPTFGSFNRAVNTMSTLVEKRCVPDEIISSEISEQPDMMDAAPSQTRSRPHHLSLTSRRMSNLWTTTTSATGMPTVERDGVVPNNISTLPGSPRSNSPTLAAHVNATKLGRVKSFPHSMPLHGTDTRPPQSEERTSSPTPQRLSSEGSAFTSLAPEIPTLDEICKTCGCRQSCGDVVIEDEDEGVVNKTMINAMSFRSKDKPAVDETIEKAKNIEQSEELDRLYDKIDCWNFPIFDVWSHGNVLRGVAYKVFKQAGFFEKFRIREQVFHNYFTALEGGYNNIPYHNSVHAADVLHGVFYFTSQRIAGFCPTDSRECLSDSDSVSGDQSEETTECVDHYDRLTSCIPDLERFALYSAAAMHDYDHPGRTNAFLVATLAPQAILYNDRSVLENHHAAQAFALLHSDPHYNYVESLTTADFKRFRFLVIEAVLATDLKRHFDVLQEFTSKVESGIDWSLESDRLLASQVCIKMADISGPSKQKDIHVRWTERIVEEFYEQGEDELSKNLPVSPYMERKTPLVAQLQETFINHLVAPLFTAYSNAGLMPGVWITTTEYDEQEESEGESSTKDEESTEHSDSGVGNAKSYPRKKPSGKKKKRRKRRKVSKQIHCEIMDNIETNYQMWVRRIKEQEIEKQSSSSSVKNKDTLKEDLDADSSEASDSSATKREREV